MTRLDDSAPDDIVRLENIAAFMRVSLSTLHRKHKKLMIDSGTIFRKHTRSRREPKYWGKSYRILRYMTAYQKKHGSI